VQKARDKMNNKSETTIDFVIVTALPEERDAVLEKLPGYQQLPATMDDIRTYFQADLHVTFPDQANGVYRIIVVCLIGMGRLQALAAAADAIRQWQPRYILLVGIAGGIANREVQIGDILISDQIVDYELQKITDDGPEIRYEVQRADPRMLDFCINFKNDAWQKLIQIKRPNRGKPRIHVGPIASGDKVIAFGDVLAKYREVWSKLIGVEMEAAGVATAAFQSPYKPGFFMVRGVSDLADENKASTSVAKWRSYACAVAASFTIELLKNGPIPLQDEKKQVEIILDGKFNNFNPSRQQDLVNVLAVLLNIDPSDIRVLSVNRGSVRVLIEMPAKIADNFYDMAIKRDERLLNLRIKSVFVEGKELVNLVNQPKDSVLKYSQALKNLRKNRILPDEIELLRQALSNGQISIGGSVSNSVIILGSGNTVQLTAEALKLLTSANKLGIAPALRQLPQPPSDFVGREEELKTILDTLHKKGGAAITGLVGMGGIGKTALGLVAAHRLAEQYADAQIFIDLRGGTKEPLQPEDVMKHVIQSFYPTARLRKSTNAELAGRYRSALVDKSVMLFFDNAHDASQVAPLLPPAKCIMLVTSRGHFLVPGLQVIELNVLDEKSAIQLLMEITSQITEKDAKRIAKLCAYLPIALRLAASNLQIHADRSVEEFIAELSDKTKRLKALDIKGVDANITAVFEQSYEQLSAYEKRYWSMLATFSTPFKRDALISVWGIGDMATRKLTDTFVQYSLLDYDANTTRYNLHDLLSDFARTKLTDEDEGISSLNYLRHYQDIWKTSEEQYVQGGDNITQGLKLFDSEFMHLENAYKWALQNASTNPAVSTLLAKIPDSLNIAHLRLHPDRRLEWLRASLVAAEKLEDFSSQNLLLGNIGSALEDLSEYPNALVYLERALKMTRRLGDLEREGFWLGNMGVVYSHIGQNPKALEYLERALGLARLSGNRLHECDCLNNIAMTFSASGELSKSIEYLEQALKIAREIGNREKEGRFLGNIGAAYINLGEYHKALEYLGQALDIAREVGDKPREDFWLGTSGFAHMYLGEFDQAIDFLEKALKIAHDNGNRAHQHNWMGNIGVIHLELGEHDKALYHLERALVIAREIGDRQSEGEWLGNIGMSYALSGENQEAKKRLEQALAIAREVGGQWQVAQWQSQLGELYVNMNEPLQARESLDEALKLSKELGIRIIEANTLFVFAKLYMSEHNKGPALQYAQEARAAFESLQSPEVKHVDEFIESLNS
jgi:nucleoside phosphorylase/tetratricopeptide (TPR) repeat protein